MKNLLLPSALLSCTIFAGCSAFTKPDGTKTVDVSPTKVEQTGQQAAVVASTVVPPPWGTLASAAILAVSTAIAAHYRGKEAGWVEAVGSPAQAGTTTNTTRV